MRFDEVDAPASQDEERPLLRHDLFLPEGSALVLSKDARYRWTHGIEKKTRDLVERIPSNANGRGISKDYLDIQERGEWIERGTRISVTFRWMLEGADVVGAD